MSYKSTHTGAQIDAGVSAALNPDATPTLSSTNLVTSGGVAAALAGKADGTDLALKAPLASPAFTGTPTAPTPTAGDDSTKVATTAFVQGEIDTADAALKQMILASFPTDTITNVAVASFTDGADGIPVKALTVNITPAQAGSGDPSPTNVREISGWGSVSLGQTLAGYVMPTIEQGGINVRGEDTVSDIRCRSEYVSASGVTHIAFAVQGNARIVAIHSYDSDKNWISRTPYPEGKTSGSVSLETGTVYLRFLFAKADTAASIVPSDIENLVVAPYSSISLGQTVYGGTLTDNGDGTWTLTVQWISVDFGTLNWVKATDSPPNYFRTEITDSRIGVTPTNYLCSHYPAVPFNDFYTDHQDKCCSGYTGNLFLVRDSDFSAYSANEFKTAMSGVQLVYRLKSAYEQTYTLTAESVRTLLGNNNIFADTGDIAALTYRADVGLYIAKKLAEA